MPLGIVLILGPNEVLNMSTFQLTRHENGINSEQVSEGKVIHITFPLIVCQGYVSWHLQQRRWGKVVCDHVPTKKRKIYFVRRITSNILKVLKSLKLFLVLTVYIIMGLVIDSQNSSSFSS